MTEPVDLCQEKIKVLKDAIAEAERFKRAANNAIKRMREDSWAKYGCKETAAAKRASMDLSNALVEVRR